MDNLKKFVDQYRDQFDAEPLPDGHLERFERKLRSRHNRPARYFLPIAATIAAAACIFAILFIKGGEYNRNQNGNGAFICEADEEMDELRSYYHMRVYDLEERMRSLHLAQPTEGSASIMHDTQEVMKSIYDFEENILPTLPCSGNGLNVMNRQYASSLETLEVMLEQMEEITNHE
ncbi:MAG: hypothetical protein LBD28_02885 [Tannerellaceae bacterium]|jgi:hypothetical protein|nr:hypothetical protein [Tannerellaceae bacterium]